MGQPACSYDVFISANRADQEWVSRWLVPRLHGAGLRVSLSRDFEIGAPVLINIEQAVVSSRHTLLVLSPSWVASEWEAFAGLLARSEDPVGHRRRTIPLLRERCTPPRSIARLIYADFTDSAQWEAQFERLVATLHGRLHRSAFGPPLGVLLGLEAPTNFIYRRNPHFVGREAELAALHELLDQATPLGVRSTHDDPGAASRLTGLTGMGGIGKTQLAVEYIYRYRAAYPGGIFWINAAEPLREGFVRVGRTLCGNGCDKSAEELVRLATDHLRSDPDTLLVLDNLPDLRLLDLPIDGLVVPSALPCRVLFTTRRRDPTSLRTVDVNTLSPEQALQLLLRHPERQTCLDPAHPEYPAAQRICAGLGYLPLALELAAAYLDEAAGAVTPTGYLERLGRYGALPTVDTLEAVAQRNPTWHDPVALTLASQWDALADEDARLLLRVAALLPEAEAIPAARLGLLTGLSDRAEAGFVPPLDQALHWLYNYSLLERLENERVRLHPLVREFAAQQTPAAGTAAFCAHGADQLAQAYADFATLEEHAARRGVGEVEEDVAAALVLTPLATLANLLQLIRRESHNLRSWSRVEHPAWFAQLLHYRAVTLGLEEWAARAAAHLAELGSPHCLLRWCRGPNVESPALQRTLAGHTGPVNAVALFADGQRAVSASIDNTLRVWDLETGQTVTLLQGHTGVVSAVALTPGDRRAVSASHDRTLRVWDLETGQTLAVLQGHTKWVNAVMITPDGRRVVSGSADGTLRLWDLNTGRTVTVLTNHTHEVRAAALVADGRRVVSASADKTLRVWDLETGQTLAVLQGHTEWVNAVTVTPDSRRVVSGSEDGTLRCWDLDTGRTVTVLYGHSGGIDAVALTTDSRRAVSASCDHTLRVWDLETGQTVTLLQGHTGGVGAVALSSDGQRAVSASTDGTLRVWNLETGQTLAVLIGHIARVKAVAVTSDRGRVVSASTDGTLRVWSMDPDQAMTAMQGHTGGVSAVALSSDSQWAISASEDKALRAWALANGQTLAVLQGHTGAVSTVVLAPDGQRAVSASEDHSLRVWNLVTGQTLAVLEGHTQPVCSVAVSPDGHQVVSGSEDHTLRLWDMETGQGFAVLRGHTGAVRAVALTADGRRAVSASADRTLRVWDLETGQTVVILQGHAGGVFAVALTADGRRVVSASWDHTLRVWDLETGQELIVLDHAPFMIDALVLTPDGRRAVSASSLLSFFDPPALRLWDLEAGQTLAFLIGHATKVSAVAVTEDGRRVVSASWDHTLRVWDLETGRELATVILPAMLHALALDGFTVIAGDDDGTVYLFRYEDGNLMGCGQ